MEERRRAVKKSKDRRQASGLVYLTGWISQESYVWLQLVKESSQRPTGEIIDYLILCAKKKEPFFIAPKPWPDYIIKAVERKMHREKLTNIDPNDPYLLEQIQLLKERMGVKGRKQREKQKLISAPLSPKKPRGKKKFDRGIPLLEPETYEE